MNKKILFVSRGLAYGGSGRTISVLANNLIKDKYNVYILICRKYEKEYFLQPEVNCIRINLESRKSKLSLWTRVTKWLPALRENIKDINPDIIIPFGVDISILSVLARRRSKSKLCVTVRSSPNNEPKMFLLRKIRNYFYKKSDYIWVQNTEQKEYFKSNVRDKTFVLGNPIENIFLENNYIPRQKIRNFVALGRLSKQKNQELLIKAFEKALQCYPDIKLYIYGNGELEDLLKKIIHKRKLGDSIYLVKRSEEIIKILTDSDAFILSSDFEGMPNALMEAMAIGLPCISTSCPTGPSELIKNGKNGYLVPVKDVDSLSVAIKRFVQKPDEAYIMGCRAKEVIIENYSEDKIYNGFKLIIEKIME